MKHALILIALLGLAACGADGEPTAPAPKAPKTGVTVSGEATIGISI